MISAVGVNMAQDYILFYGNGCPHCAKVEQYFKENDVQEKFDIVLKEVYFNRNNLTELQDYLAKFHLDTTQIGVPFLVINNENECNYINGSDPIIDFFQKKMDMMATLEQEHVECNTETCSGLSCEQQTLEEAQPVVKNIIKSVGKSSETSLLQSGVSQSFEDEALS